MNTDTAAKITGSKVLKDLKLPTKSVKVNKDNTEMAIAETFTESKKSRSIGKKILLGLVGAATITGVASTFPNVKEAEAWPGGCGNRVVFNNCGGYWGGGWDYGYNYGGGDIFLGSFLGNLAGNVISNAFTPRQTVVVHERPQVEVIERVVEKPVYVYEQQKTQEYQYQPSSSQPYQQLQQQPQQNAQPVVFAWSTKVGGRYMDSAGNLHQSFVDKAGNAHDSVMGYLDENGNVHQRMLEQNGKVTDTVIGSIYRNDW